MVRRAGFLLDLHRCTGCSACVLACRLEHGWPASAPMRRVVPLNAARHPGGPTYFLSAACHHCEKPACVENCPARALEQRPDGIVMHLESRCLGCRYCEMACPFGAPRFDEENGIARKCDFCSSRVDRGEPPACVGACPTGALRTLDGIDTGGTATVPGFADSAGCGPSIRFRRPRGISGARLAEFERLGDAP